jgi:hypothetical protein
VADIQIEIPGTVIIRVEEKEGDHLQLKVEDLIIESLEEDQIQEKVIFH